MKGLMSHKKIFDLQLKAQFSAHFCLTPPPTDCLSGMARVYVVSFAEKSGPKSAEKSSQISHPCCLMSSLMA